MSRVSRIFKFTVVSGKSSLLKRRVKGKSSQTVFWIKSFNSYVRTGKRYGRSADGKYFLRKRAKTGKSLLTLSGQIDLQRYDLTFVYLRNTRQCESR